jgi:acetyl esterase/lipase
MSGTKKVFEVLGAAQAVADMAGGWLLAEMPPHVLGAQAVSRISVGPVRGAAHSVAAQRADAVLDRALRDGLGQRYAERAVHPRTPSCREAPVGLLTVARHRRRYTGRTADLSYGEPGPAHLLDIWRRRDLQPGARAPVLIHIPGGAWSLNNKRGQGYSLMAAMSERGWICVSVNYRRSPHHAWPAHIVDVKRAIAWVRANIAGYGGDPEFIAVTGGSAGGHLCALAALTPNDAALQPGFEDADTTVRAAAPLYGVFDLTEARHMHPKMMGFLEHVVVQAPLAHNRAVYERASPVHRVGATAPPFFILHGQKDTVVPPGQSRVFDAALRKAGARTVLHAELPNAHHAFDMVAGVRSHLVAQAVATFLGVVYGEFLAARPSVAQAGY